MNLFLELGVAIWFVAVLEIVHLAKEASYDDPDKSTGILGVGILAAR